MNSSPVWRCLDSVGSHGANHMEGEWCEPRGEEQTATPQGSSTAHLWRLVTVWNWFPFPLEKINSSELGHRSSCCTTIRVRSCVQKLSMTHKYLFLISYRGATMTLRRCINSVCDAARLSWKWTPNVCPERNFVNGTHISAICYNPEYRFTSHQLSVILYIFRGCRVDKFDVKPNNSIKGK